MDDNQFDDLIKGKVSEYQEPGFDPAGLADLHYRMAAADAVWPWYVRYRTELFVGTGLILCTLIILWSQWFLSNKENMLLENNLLASKNSGDQIKLQNEINYLKSLQPDTIKIIEFREQNSIGYSVLLNRIANLEATLERYASLSVEKQIRSGLDSVPSQKEFFSEYEQQHINNSPQRLVPRQMERESARAQWNDMYESIQTKERSLSVKAMRDIEDHYQKGIGIRIGPTIELSKGIYSLGSGKIDIAGGLLADFILSPSLSLETGGKYAHRVYQISDQDDLATTQLPNVEQNLGAPKNADIDSWILEIPLNLKYRYPTSLKSHLLGGIGFSSMLFTRQLLEYDYNFDGNSSATIYSVYNNLKPQLYFGTINFSLGFSNQTKTKKIIETSLYYQHGVGTIGVENTKQSFLGIRSVYWFKIR